MGEPAPNLIDLGKELGLEIGQKYPGKEVLVELLTNYEKTNKGKSYIIKHLNMDNPKYIWRALT